MAANCSHSGTRVPGAPAAETTRPHDGFGHVYAPQDYFDAWVQVTGSDGLDEAQLADLRQRLTRHGERQLIEGGWFRIPATD